GGGAQKVHWIAWRKLCRSKKEEGLVFRRLKEFNMAMLAKQAWKVVVNPHSLLSQILQQKDLLVVGVRWQIGNGELVSITGVPWLPRPMSFQLIFQPRSLQPDTKVVALCLDNSGWNETLISEEFEQIDADCILSILVPIEHGRDEIVWHYGKQGKFSVKSEYSLACHVATEATPSSV
ncbi:UNVERIFIED_CONTAM: putative mitochondrial protein, partial [Sesamum latifolium]